MPSSGGSSRSFTVQTRACRAASLARTSAVVRAISLPAAHRRRSPPGRGPRAHRRRAAGGREPGDEFGELVEVGALVDPPALFDVVNHLSDLVEDGAVDVAQHLVDLGLALAHHEVAVDAAVLLGAVAVELGQPVEGPLEVFRVEAVEALYLHRRLRQDFPGDGDHDRPVARVFEVLGDGQVGDGARPQHGAVGFLAPQVAEHIVSGLGVRKRLHEVEHARRDTAAVELADAEGRDVALHDAPRGHNVGAEVDKRRDDPHPADRLDEGDGCEAVLHGQHVAVGGESAAQQFGGGSRVQALDGHDGVLDLAGEFLGRDRVRGHGELVDRALDDQPVLADGGDVGLVGVTQRDVVAGADHVGAESAANGTGADDGDFHGVRNLLSLSYGDGAVEEVADGGQEQLALFDLRRVAGLLEHHQLRIRHQGRDGFRGADRGDPVEPSNGDERWRRYRGELRLEVIAPPVVLEAPVVRFVTVDAGLDALRRANGVVLVVVQGDDLGPACLKVLVVVDLPGPVTVEIVPVDLDAVLVPRVLEGKLQVVPVGGGVAQHDRLDVLGVGHGVLQGDEPAVGAARGVCRGGARASPGGMTPPEEPPATTILSAPIHSRKPSTSAAHWAWEYGGMPSLSPQPRATKTTTRNRSERGPKASLGSASEPIPPPPWWAISTGPSSGPITSTFSSQPLMVTLMLMPPLRSSARSRHRAG